MKKIGIRVLLILGILLAIAGIVFAPARRLARSLLSPAIRSYPLIDFFTIIG